jgi:ABC-type transport system involved in cytochrome c biogenesis permease component
MTVNKSDILLESKKKGKYNFTVCYFYYILLIIPFVFLD